MALNCDIIVMKKSSLQKKYLEEIVPQLKETFKYKNINEVPSIKKVIVNCVSKDSVKNSKTVEVIAQSLASITGQKPVIAKAKKSIATFKLRENQALGAFVTLRSKKMFEFIERLIHFSLPRVKDFRGLSLKAFDGRGNYTLGIKEQIIFPEIDYDKIDKIRGLGISFVTTAKTDNEGRELLKLMGMPFKRS